jgi:hypothetical protein
MLLKDGAKWQLRGRNGVYVLIVIPMPADLCSDPNRMVRAGLLEILQDTES